MTTYFRHKTQTTEMGYVTGLQGENYVSHRGRAFGVNNPVDVAHFKSVPELEIVSTPAPQKAVVSDGDKFVEKLVKAGVSAHVADELLSRYVNEASLKDAFLREEDLTVEMSAAEVKVVKKALKVK